MDPKNTLRYEFKITKNHKRSVNSNCLKFGQILSEASLKKKLFKVVNGGALAAVRGLAHFTCNFSILGGLAAGGTCCAFLGGGSCCAPGS